MTLRSRRVRWSATVLSVSLVLTACVTPTDNSQKAQPVISALPRALSGDEQVAATATTEFGLALFRSVNARTARDSSLTLSPVSASLALALLLNGAEGETFDQVRRTLGFGDRALAPINAAYKSLIPLLTTLDPSVKMTFANAAWFSLSSPPSAAYSERVADTFAAKVATLSFGAPATVTTINTWASDATNARIPKIVDRFNGDEIAFLANATYFKGKWRSQFAPSDTRPSAFRVTAAQTVQVPTMSSATGLIRIGTLPDGTQVGELPYGGDAFVMDIVLPPLGRIESTIDSLTPTRWRSMLATLPDSMTSTLVQLPKFRLEVSRVLNEDLIALGMPRPFASAQLVPMFASPMRNLAVSTVLQKVFVDVNEEGTEAAAVTSITIELTSAGPRGFVVDRPFLFVIRDRLTGTILFMGKVLRPMAP